MAVIRSIAWRFMMKGTEKGHFSAMTFFSWLAIGVGVAAMSGLLSVMYGFENSLKTKVLNAYPHIIVNPSEGSGAIKDDPQFLNTLRSLADITRVVPYIETEMILQSQVRTLGGVIWGLKTEDFDRVKKGLVEGELPSINSALPEVVMGKELAHRLNISPGDKVKIISPTAKVGFMAAVPKTETFKVSGLYASGHYEFDEQYLYMPIEDAQDILGWNEAVSGYHIWTPSLDQADEVQKKLTLMLPPNLKAESWSVFNAALFQSLKLEQYCMSTILSFAILIAVMNIVITLMMHVTHKRKNIGVLRALGASKAQIRQIFVWQGTWMGLVGLALGAVLTTIFVLYIRYFSQYQLPDIYYDRTIPLDLRPASFLMIFGGAILLIYLATLFPSLKAARLDPIEAIRE
ncbi:MAG: ABC transporter permease [Deltaproteobacteria bacterium]|nr:ABC transporter permease [Deltaproteobacteria bacterium]